MGFIGHLFNRLLMKGVPPHLDYLRVRGIGLLDLSQDFGATFLLDLDTLVHAILKHKDTTLGAEVLLPVVSDDIIDRNLHGKGGRGSAFIAQPKG